jgi:hypothetical protein
MDGFNSFCKEGNTIVGVTLESISRSKQNIWREKKHEPYEFTIPLQRFLEA